MKKEKRVFLYATEIFYKMKYTKLLFISFFYSLITSIPFCFPVNNRNIKVSAVLFIVSFILSQIIFVSVRYVIPELKEIFANILKIKSDSVSIWYVLYVILFHMIYLVVLVYVLLT